MKAKNKRLALQDIADQVGVTKMTVSRYLRGPDQVSKTTGERIQKVIDEVGYVSSRVPDILSNATSKAIGIVVPSLSNQVFSAVVQGIENITEPAGYQTMIAHYGYDREVEEKRIESMLSYHVDGLILSECDHTEKSLRMIANAGIPVVEVMDACLPPIDLAVGLDHQAASEAMLKKMISRGKHRIVFFAARMDVRVRQRLAGYQAVMSELGAEPVILSTEEHSSFTLGKTLMMQALSQYPTLDGVFCCNDDLGIGAILECQRRNITIPDQIAIAGFNALDIGRAIHPNLASISTPRKAIGETAAQMLLDKLAGKDIEDKVIDLGFSIFEGNSI
ncbi:substrate-binding domain-containing protein [Endozoicomonas numazuensis]|uniref:Transcriptional regulator n=1 Tax=Endozoicomonas numazuensis TaxID=1137799 RepID=A0A081NEX1_9GAMM|nr:substrate-binding domain-containing protein [Endozoicomonas numazuensis]KEQ16994.1 transcriptional regulator [Endozoicomonas numazuensis]